MRIKKGTITSTKMDNTVVVLVNSYKAHSKYHKRFRVSKKFYADTKGFEGEVREGDLVLISECRPLSKLKCWKLQEVIDTAI